MRFIVPFLLLWMTATGVCAQKNHIHKAADAEASGMPDRKTLLQRIWHYPDSVLGKDTDTIGDTLQPAADKQAPPAASDLYSIEVQHRNILMLAMPHMARLAYRRQRHFIGRPLRPVRPFLTPNIYGTTLVADNLLSPFHHSNRIYYRYRILPADSGRVELLFTPKIRNTQTVSGRATLLAATGQVLSTTIQGEYGLLRFDLDLTMGQAGRQSLKAERCDVDSRIRFLGNRVRVRSVPADSIAPDTADVKRRPTQANTADAVWEVIDDNLLSRIRLDFGNPERHQFTIGPLFNPLYMSYSSSNGVVYKLNTEFRYCTSHYREFYAALKGGYSFRQRRLYFQAPVRYTFNSDHEAYVQASVSNGNHITNSTLLDQLKALPQNDTVRFDTMNLDYFRDLALRLTTHYAFSQRLAVTLGAVFHRRSAVTKESFHRVGEPAVYHTFAPLVGITFRPAGNHGPVFQADYEHGMKGIFRSNIEYDRAELDASYTLALPCTRRLTMRFGSGMYASRKHGMYFIDYDHFSRNHLSGGWIDDAVDFKLLDSHWFNASDYYLRLGAIYESPLLMLAHMPLVGRFVERERIYFNTLAVRHLAPYSEIGYTLRNHVFSAGVFASFSRHGFEDFGLSFGLELFEGW